MSPYVRHGLVDLPTLWQHVAPAAAAGPDEVPRRAAVAGVRPPRLRPHRRGPGRAAAPRSRRPPGRGQGEAWPAQMLCVRTVTDELHRDGWLVNQTRMWLASQWTVRAGWDWREGEDAFYRHLLDGSRAANRLGWQWTVGTGSGKPYGFSRWQVEKRAPGLCGRCPLRDACPIQGWPEERPGPRVGGARRPARAAARPGRWPGPPSPEGDGRRADRGLAHLRVPRRRRPGAGRAPGPARRSFVFDAPLLARLRLSGKRLVFLAETLASLATRRDVEVHRGRPGGGARRPGRSPSRTPRCPASPRPPRRSGRRRAAPVALAGPPRPAGPAQSFSAWRRSSGR